VASRSQALEGPRCSLKVLHESGLCRQDGSADLRSARHIVLRDKPALRRLQAGL